jgi:hypothetical protein
MASQLSDVEAPVSDIQIMRKILCTLPPSYRAFTTAWDSVPATEKTIALLTSRLLKEETMAKRWTRGQRDSSPQQMNSRENRGSGSSRGRGGFNRRHSFRKHPYNPNFCTYCGLGPHKAAVCRNRIRDEAEKAEDTGGSAVDKKEPSKRNNNDTRFLSDFTYFAAYCLKEWYADSGATQHMSGQRSLFRNVPVKHNTWFVNGIGGSRLQVHGHGEILFTATVKESTHYLSIKMVLYVPDLGTNLLSIAAVTEFGRTVHFVESLVNFNNFDKTVIVGKRIGQTLYHLAITANPSDESAYLTSPAPPSIAVWHQRFAHVSCKKISQMAAK